MPDFSPAQRHYAEIKEIIVAGGTLPIEQHSHLAERRAHRLYPERRHIDSPCVFIQFKGLFPDSGGVFDIVGSQDIIAFARNNEFRKSEFIEGLL